jgi:hypothetical protein
MTQTTTTRTARKPREVKVEITFHARNWNPLPITNMIAHLDDAVFIKYWERTSLTRFTVSVKNKRLMARLMRLLTRETSVMGLNWHLPTNIKRMNHPQRAYVQTTPMAVTVL